MKTVLDHLIATAPDENNGAVQIQLTVGVTGYAGAVKKSELGDDIYELLTVGQTPDQRPVMVTVYVCASDITSIQVMSSEKPSSLVVPKKSGLVMPGLS